MATTKISTDVIDLSGNTEALTIPKGNTGPNTTDTTGTCDYPITASALYQLNDNADDTCGNSDGAFTNSSYVTGKFGNAASFNGSNNYIEVPVADTPSFLVSTVTFWVKTTTSSQDGVIGTGYDSGGYWNAFQAYCYGNTTGALVVRYGNGTAEGPQINGTSAINTGNWVFCAVTMSGSAVGSTIKLYVNGSLETTHTTTVSRADNTQKGLIMGAYSAAGTIQNFFTGAVDQARIFPSVLTASQITELYNETNITSTGGRPTSPTEGLMRENTTTGKMEFYDGSLWQEINDTASSYSTDLIPSANFNTVLNTSPSTSQSIAAGFTPDAVWIKGYNIGSGNPTSWGQYDTVRGSGESLQSDNTDGEYDYSGHPAGDLGMDFTSTGYDTPPLVNNNINNSSDDYVSYFWKAGGAFSHSASGSGSGSTLASSGKSNQPAGFSIVKFTVPSVSSGQSRKIKHNLGDIPELIIYKTLNSSQATAWFVYTPSIGNNHELFLNTNGSKNGTTRWNNTTPDATTFDIGAAILDYTGVSNTNFYGGDTIAYCWTSIPGYSKIGFYIGTETTQNIYMGFKPAWIMIKSTTSGAGNSYWTVFDNKRNPSNPRTCEIYPNSTDSEYCTVGSAPNYRGLNFTDTGIELLSTSYNNEAFETFIYMAFSE